MINQEKIAVVGLGYVGLPLALAFAQKFDVVGFDINRERVEKLRRGEDPSKELGPSEFKGKRIVFTSDIEDISSATFYVVAVPTPVTEANEPDLRPLLGASETVGKVLKRGDCVVFESTVYPGCTEEDCVPMLESLSGLKAGKDFKFGYSPERINPGDKVHTLKNTVKIVSGSDKPALERVARVYGSVVEAGVHKAPSIMVAEAAKIIENTQRDVNIALMNELSILFGRMGINTYDVLEAAGTKWNFLKFYPGLVGGHCIGVDPYYLVHKAHQLKYHTKVINAGRFVNDSMGGYIGKKVVKELIKGGRAIKGAKVLVLGITFKEDVADIRNSKVVNIVEELESYGVKACVYDPYADPQEVKKAYGISLIKPSGRAKSEGSTGGKSFLGAVGKGYDAVLVAVAHKQMRKLTEKDFLELTYPGALLVDIKGLYRGRITKMNYWSL